MIKIKIAVVFICIICYIEANYYRDANLRQKGIDPDYMHYLAMQTRMKGERVKARF